ncbi:MAG TPA: ScpA family protein [Ktedonobacteraceae bacterium]|nr:ScpA family protein [Ktedonobacteraceae bacterium]
MFEQANRIDTIQSDVAVDAVAEANEHALSYVVRLPVFEGPLDLLLHLIEKRQMEITTISLVAVTDQYLAYLREHLYPIENDPDSAHAVQAQAILANMAAFVSIAARLLFIKSQSLLPRTTPEQVSAEAESAAVMAEDLQRHLLEYKLAKEIAYHLRRREEAGLQTYGRSGLLAGIEAQLAWTPPTLTGLDTHTLAHAFQRLLELHARDEANGAELMPLARVRVSERIAEIISMLSERSTSLLLSEVIANERSRLVIIVTFLAVLELWKQERLVVRQDVLLGPIVLDKGPRWSEQIPVDEERL